MPLRGGRLMLCRYLLFLAKNEYSLSVLRHHSVIQRSREDSSQEKTTVEGWEHEPALFKRDAIFEELNHELSSENRDVHVHRSFDLASSSDLVSTLVHASSVIPSVVESVSASVSDSGTHLSREVREALADSDKHIENVVEVANKRSKELSEAVKQARVAVAPCLKEAREVLGRTVGKILREAVVVKGYATDLRSDPELRNYSRERFVEAKRDVVHILEGKYKNDLDFALSNLLHHIAITRRDMQEALKSAALHTALAHDRVQRAARRTKSTVADAAAVASEQVAVVTRAVEDGTSKVKDSRGDPKTSVEAARDIKILRDAAVETANALPAASSLIGQHDWVRRKLTTADNKMEMQRKYLSEIVPSLVNNATGNATKIVEAVENLHEQVRELDKSIAQLSESPPFGTSRGLQSNPINRFVMYGVAVAAAAG
ncbi:hypothetical protein HDU93_008531, partial [Gonapodya sp. JEL0774]